MGEAPHSQTQISCATREFRRPFPFFDAGANASTKRNFRGARRSESSPNCSGTAAACGRENGAYRAWYSGSHRAQSAWGRLQAGASARRPQGRTPSHSRLACGITACPSCETPVMIRYARPIDPESSVHYLPIGVWQLINSEQQKTQVSPSRKIIGTRVALLSVLRTLVVLTTTSDGDG